MSLTHRFRDLLPLLPWLFIGASVGLGMLSLARVIPRKALHRVQAPLSEWVGPGGGLESPVSPARRIWVPLLNASLWAFAAGAASHPAILVALLSATFASALVLLALIDWDSTMLPDAIVLPLGLAGLVSSYAGITSQSLRDSAVSAVVLLVLLGGLAWMFRRIRGVSGIGGGDIKLLAALATWWGVAGVLIVVPLASVITVIWNLIWRRFRGLDPQAEWPFGPAIVIAALIWNFLITFFPS
jgi:leader peptidase (prepilin peptidase) / N-methyltransferase